MKRLLLLLALIIIVLSCSDEQVNETETFLKIRKTLIEIFDNGKLISKEIYYYNYKAKTDFFWETSIKVNSLNKDTIKTKRFFDEKSGFPIKEIIFKNGVPIRMKETTYNQNNFELTHLTEYQIEQNDTFLISKLIRTYKKGYLITEQFEFYSKYFLNINGSNLIKSYKIRNLQPFNFLPKGYFKLNEFFEYYIEFQIDSTKINYRDTLKFIKTNYDNKGFPTDITTKEYDDKNNKIITTRQWFVNELDEDSNLVSIIAYQNEKRDFINDNSYKIYFITDNVLISEIQKYFYNFEDKDFKKFSEMKVFDWLIPEFYSRYNFTDFDYSDEIYNYQDSSHSLSEKKIVRWDDVGVKKVEFKKDSYIGEYESRDFSPKLVKRITFVFDKIEKTGPKIVYKRNKKY